LRCIIYIYRTNLSLYIYHCNYSWHMCWWAVYKPLTNDWLTYTSTFTLFYWEKLEHTTLFLVAKSVVLVKPISGVQIVILTSITHFSYCSSYNPPPFTMSVSCPVGSAGPFLINLPFQFWLLENNIHFILFYVVQTSTSKDYVDSKPPFWTPIYKSLLSNFGDWCALY